MNCKKSLRKRANRSGDRLSPCLTPTLHRKYSDVILSFCIHDLALAYMFLITFNNLPFISCDKSFCQRSGLIIINELRCSMNPLGKLDV